MDDVTKTQIEIANYAAVTGLLIAAIAALSTRRRRTQPLFTVA
jgi:hypothetical protein